MQVAFSAPSRDKWRYVREGIAIFARFQLVSEIMLAASGSVKEKTLDGLLSVPVLAGSAAYAVAETFKFREGLYLKLRQAPAFYGVIALATFVGAGMNLIGSNPISALHYGAILNGIVAPPLLFMIMLISNNRKIMQNKTNGCTVNILGWIAKIAMGLAAIALLVSLGIGK